MAYTPPKQRDGTRESTPRSQHSEPEHPRIVEEHHVVGPHGEDEIEATDECGRRWYHLRPEPRRRADVLGFNYTWWLVIWAIFLIALVPWGGGWGW